MMILFVLLGLAVTSSVAVYYPPIGTNRTCSVEDGGSFAESLCEDSDYSFFDVHLVWKDDLCDCDHAKLHYATVCPGYRGMNLTFQCRTAGAGVIYSVLENRSLGEGEYQFNSLQSVHAGEYQCRSSDGEIAASYNITVLPGVAVGLDSSQCGFGFNYNETHDCFEDDSITITVFNSDIITNYFYVLGTLNVTVRHLWITSPQDHYPTDLGLYPDSSITPSERQFVAKISHVPKKINVKPEILVIVTAHGESSNSVCIPVEFDGKQSLSANESLPQNMSTALEKTATFECELGTLNPDDLNEKFIFEYSQFLENDNVTEDGAVSMLVWSKYCTAQSFDLPCYNLDDDNSGGGYVLNSTITTDESTFKKYRFTFKILNVDTRHNNSIFSCSIFSGGQIQWKHSAYLTVTPVGPATWIVVVGVVTVVVVCVVALCLTVGIVLVWRWRRKRGAVQMEPDQVPLTNHDGTLPTLCDSEASTPIESANGFEFTKRPTIQIVDCGNAVVNSLTVGEPMPVPDSDQGYQSSQSYDQNSQSYDLSIGDQLKTMIHNSSRTPPTTLGLVTEDCPTDFESSQGEVDSYLWQEKCIVYISYTERMGRWVREWLKPLIESWKHSEVMLHEDDMIPGFTIPGERQRLILEAHKVVLVVSRDYSESPWCLYELQHAIQQEPALCRGRIIPILVDGCHTLPSIVRGIVPLMEKDRNFSMRLKKNILGR